MAVSVLKTLMQRVRQGDHNARLSLRGQLANRLIYVPRVGVRTESGRGTRIRIVMYEEAGQKRIPVFTTEESYRKWRSDGNRRGDYFSILGGDLCTAVDTDAWIVLDPGTEDSVLLSPEDNQMIALIGVEDDVPETLSGSASLESAAGDGGIFKDAGTTSLDADQQNGGSRQAVVELPGTKEIVSVEAGPDNPVLREHKVDAHISRVSKVVGESLKEPPRDPRNYSHHLAGAPVSGAPVSGAPVSGAQSGKKAGFLKRLLSRLTK